MVTGYDTVRCCANYTLTSVLRELRIVHCSQCYSIPNIEHCLILNNIKI